jgi:hypothetical protein
VYDKDHHKVKYLVEWPDHGINGWQRLALASPPEPGHALYRSKDYDAIRTVLTHIAYNQTDETINALRAAGDAPWVKPLLGIYLKRKGNLREATRVLDAAMKESRSRSIEQWIAGIRPSFQEKLAHQSWYKILSLKNMKRAEVRMAEKVQKAPTPDKKMAIEWLFRYWGRYRYNTGGILMFADIINETDRNVPVIERIAEYSLRPGSNTLIYIGIAKYAAKSKSASREFVDLAAVVERNGGTLDLVQLAGRLAKAKNEEELRPLRKKITVLRDTEWQ